MSVVLLQESYGLHCHADDEEIPAPMCERPAFECMIALLMLAKVSTGLGDAHGLERGDGLGLAHGDEESADDRGDDAHRGNRQRIHHHLIVIIP